MTVEDLYRSSVGDLFANKLPTLAREAVVNDAVGDVPWRLNAFEQLFEHEALRQEDLARHTRREKRLRMEREAARADAQSLAADLDEARRLVLSLEQHLDLFMDVDFGGRELKLNIGAACKLPQVDLQLRQVLATEQRVALLVRQNDLRYQKLKLHEVQVDKQLERHRQHWACVLERQREKHRGKLGDLRDENKMLWTVNHGLYESLRDVRMNVVHTSGKSCSAANTGGPKRRPRRYRRRRGTGDVNPSPPTGSTPVREASTRIGAPRCASQRAVSSPRPPVPPVSSCALPDDTHMGKPATQLIYKGGGATARRGTWA